GQAKPLADPKDDHCDDEIAHDVVGPRARRHMAESIASRKPHPKRRKIGRRRFAAVLKFEPQVPQRFESKSPSGARKLDRMHHIGGAFERPIFELLLASPIACIRLEPMTAIDAEQRELSIPDIGDMTPREAYGVSFDDSCGQL